MTIKFETTPGPLSLPTHSPEAPETAHRLIALVPAKINFSAATQRIWELSQAGGLQIQLIGLPDDPTEESRLRRELATMASLLQEGKSCAETKIETGTKWVQALEMNCESGDLVVCFAEQETGRLRKPLGQILRSNLKATVYILSDPNPQKSNANRLSQISMWLGIIVVITGFGLLQVRIVQLPTGWLQNIVLILSIVPEFALIWVWDGWCR